MASPPPWSPGAHGPGKMTPGDSLSEAGTPGSVSLGEAATLSPGQPSINPGRARRSPAGAKKPAPIGERSGRMGSGRGGRNHTGRPPGCPWAGATPGPPRPHPASGPAGPGSPPPCRRPARRPARPAAAAPGSPGAWSSPGARSALVVGGAPHRTAAPVSAATPRRPRGAGIAAVGASWPACAAVRAAGRRSRQGRTRSRWETRPSRRP